MPWPIENILAILVRPILHRYIFWRGSDSESSSSVTLRKVGRSLDSSDSEGFRSSDSEDEKITKSGEAELEEEENRQSKKIHQNHIVSLYMYGPSFNFRGVPWTVMICLLRNYDEIIYQGIFDWAWAIKEESIMKKSKAYDYFPILDKLWNYEDSKNLDLKLSSMKDEALRTTWIVREIDKITAMVYFAIIVSIFISAEFLLPGFLDKFLVGLQGGNQTEDGGQNATTTGGGLLARIIIIVFSFIALGAILYMLYRRQSELRSKTWMAFKFLVELDAIKIENKHFDSSLKDIERYLTNGDWTMARYWVERVMDEYDDLIRELGGKKKKKLEE